MCSITESRRATVSCKNLFSSNTNERSTPSSTSTSRRHFYNHANIRRFNNNNNNNTNVNTFPRPTKTNEKLNDITNEKSSNSSSICDNEKKLFRNNKTNKLIQTSLNPLSPVFYSTRHISLISEQKQDTISNDINFPLLSETSDYGSGTDIDFQSIRHISPQTDSSPFTFDFDEPSYTYINDDTNNNSLQNRRTSLSSSSSSSSSSSPSSSMSNLSSLSSSSSIELKTNRLINKKLLSLNNNNNTTTTTTTISNELCQCNCEKENSSSNRKRNRFNSYPIRRYSTMKSCENCQIKRTKLNSRSKYQQKLQSQQHRTNNSHLQQSSSVKFSVDLTGLNISYTIEYHEQIKCTCSTTTLLPYYNTSFNRCKCLSLNDWSLFLMMNQYNNDLYYIDINNNHQHNLWFQQIPHVPFVNYYDFYLTKANDNNNNHLSSIYFDEKNAMINLNEHIPAYYFRCMPPTIQIESIQPPPTRSWLRLASPALTESTAIFTVMNYNILCDKYATRYVYDYCPSWALKWEYRRKQILDELRSYSADIIALQEIETDQFHLYFLPELKKLGYDGVFSPKSRAKTMGEQERRFVDGCAIFYRQSKFRLIKDYLVEFNQLAMSAANGPACHDMMNRVMTKDNIGLVALLETKEDIYSHAYSNNILPSNHKQMLFVCTAHIHWDPEYSDVKVIQTLMLLSELKTIMEDAMQKHRTNSNAPTDDTSVPLVLCGDFNSLPDSGVIELMRNGRISMNHADFKDLRYESYLQKISRIDVDSSQNQDIVHDFKLQSAYETTSSPIMPYTNYTYDFKGIIDYVFFSPQLMRVLGVLGPVDPEWLQSNKIFGCPHPNVPSDHFSLLVEFELNPTTHDLTETNNNNNNNNSSQTSTTPISIEK